MRRISTGEMIAVWLILVIFTGAVSGQYTEDESKHSAAKVLLVNSDDS